MGSFYRDISDIAVISAGFLLYNFIAFALQVPVGYIADRIKTGYEYFSILGCLLVAAGLIFPLFPWAKLVFCAFGNALFHVGGGIDSLVSAQGKFARSGIFISFGAIGVAVGTVAGKSGRLPVWVVLVFLMICVVLQMAFCRDIKRPVKAEFAFKPTVIKQVSVVIYLSMLGIVIRAVVGAYMSIPWKSTVVLAVLPGLCVFAGKFLGGFLADRMGARKIAFISLVISAPLLAFFEGNILLCCIGLLIFNMSTAMTLCVIVSMMPHNPGLGFGLTTLALCVGTAFSFFIPIPPQIRPYLIILFIFVSAVLMLFILPGKAPAGTHRC